ncbi:hypothetical protein VCHA53O466_40334 [Vibrio chagasii]|nr:hypothetical protein VCHA53O466_40334 [Vibrio chagasii]
MAVLKSAKRDVLVAIDAKIEQTSTNLPMRQIEKCKSLIATRQVSAFKIVSQACLSMKGQQYVKFLISLDRVSPDALSCFFKFIDSSQDELSLALKVKTQYIVHAVYFSDVFLDAKVVK